MVCPPGKHKTKSKKVTTRETEVTWCATGVFTVQQIQLLLVTLAFIFVVPTPLWKEHFLKHQLDTIEVLSSLSIGFLLTRFGSKMHELSFQGR